MKSGLLAESIFDDDVKDETFSLWEKPTEGTSALWNSEVIFQAPLLKYSVKEKKLVRRYFVLTKERLYYIVSENNPMVVASMNIEWVKFTYLEDHENEKSEVRSIFRLSKNRHFFDLYNETDHDLVFWKNAFAKVCIQCNFSEKFRTLKLIGKGSFARVYLVEKLEDSTKYAVKAFSKEYLKSKPKGKNVLVNEIRIMKKLDHPNVIKLFEVFESANSVYLVLELIEGGEVLALFHTEDETTEKIKRHVLKGILSGISLLIENKIIHRDLKPTNILMKSSQDLVNPNNYKLVDFGIACFTEDEEQLQKRCGTPGFFAPEVIEPSLVHHKNKSKCDLFSLGIFMYMLITNEPPFEGKDYNEIFENNKLFNIDFEHPKLKNDKNAFNLVKRLLDLSPETRINPQEALVHSYFTDSHETKIMIEEKYQEKMNDFRIYLKNFRNKQFQNEKNEETNTFEMNRTLFCGTLNTLENSENSQGIIKSLKSMGSKKVKTVKKQDSILKMVLLQNSEINSKDNFKNNFTEENIESDIEND